MLRRIPPQRLPGEEDEAYDRPLEIRTEVEHVLVNGVPVSLDNRRQSLYEGYRSRPQPER